MPIPTGHQLSNDHRDLMRMQRARQRARIVSDNLEATDIIRPAHIMQAREAIDRGAYDAPHIFDTALDNLVERAFSEVEMEEARLALMDEAFDEMCQTDR